MQPVSNGQWQLFRATILVRGCLKVAGQWFVCIYNYIMSYSISLVGCYWLVNGPQWLNESKEIPVGTCEQIQQHHPRICRLFPWRGSTAKTTRSCSSSACSAAAAVLRNVFIARIGSSLYFANASFVAWLGCLGWARVSTSRRDPCVGIRGGIKHNMGSTLTLNCPIEMGESPKIMGDCGSRLPLAG